MIEFVSRLMRYVAPRRAVVRRRVRDRLPADPRAVLAYELRMRALRGGR
ncbi:hypothetical protein SAMN05444320_11418 [Streptoalloteichus hindustanus]|uniref:Uncharacterized protein n=1 Tax=Streptoalloteichus hindustanus TaxID=2017 RepID=A0A1M5MRG7_STRHI|nr:hypothetical protein SAMN05444320_11418 [Streptoalloteichus hindustanus]